MFTRTSFTMKITFFFLSFEIGGYALRVQNIRLVWKHILYNSFLIICTLLLLSVFKSTAYLANYTAQILQGSSLL